MYILFIFLVTENIIERFIPSISWFDEVITIILFILTIINFVKYPIQKKSYLRIYIYLIFLIIIGLAGNYIYDIQKSPIAIIKDIVALLKFFIVYIYAERYISLKKSQKIIKKILKFVRIYLIFLMIFAIINQFTNIGRPGWAGSLSGRACAPSRGGWRTWLRRCGPTSGVRCRY